MADSGRIGQQVGDYHLVRRLGGGSFGEVYLAEDRHIHESVAIKLLQAKLSQKEEWREFLNEARTFRLKHPHIMPLLDFGITDDEVPYLVMEYAPGGTLRDRHPKGTQVPLATVVSTSRLLLRRCSMLMSAAWCIGMSNPTISCCQPRARSCSPILGS